MKFSIVITTIFLPRVLGELAVNFRRYSREKEVEVIVIGDNKTPSETSEYVKRFAKDGFNFEYWDIEKQKQWLKRFPELDDIIPYNTDNRRNVGYLVAYERGSDCLISMDDDNYPGDDDFMGGHARVGKTLRLPTVRSNSGWFNVCDMLEIEDGQRVYPRGYPYASRWVKDEAYEIDEAEGKIVVNAGLWLGDPDVDAVTRLNRPVNVLGLKRDILVLDPSTNCPFNTQNTAFHREILPAYYYVLMGESLGGLKIDRYGDIWSSYLSRKVIDRMGGRVSFGTPLTIHRRHDHDLLKDLGQEYWGMMLTNSLVVILEQIHLTNNSYFENYKELSLKLEEKVSEQNGLSKEIKRYFYKICGNMRIWVDVCSALDGSR